MSILDTIRRWLLFAGGIIALSAVAIAPVPAGDQQIEDVIVQLARTSGVVALQCPRCGQNSDGCYLCSLSCIEYPNDSLCTLVSVCVDAMDARETSSETRSLALKALSTLPSASVPVLLEEWYGTRWAARVRRGWSVEQGLNGPRNFVERLICAHADAAAPWCLWYLEQGCNPVERHFVLRLLSRLRAEIVREWGSKLNIPGMTGVERPLLDRALAMSGSEEGMRRYVANLALSSEGLDLRGGTLTAARDFVEAALDARAGEHMLQLVKRLEAALANDDDSQAKNVAGVIRAGLLELRWQTDVRLWCAPN